MVNFRINERLSKGVAIIRLKELLSGLKGFVGEESTDERIQKLLAELPPEKRQTMEEAGQLNLPEKKLVRLLEKRVGWHQLEKDRLINHGTGRSVDAEEIAAELREVKPHSKGGMNRSPKARRRGPLHKG